MACWDSHCCTASTAGSPRDQHCMAVLLPIQGRCGVSTDWQASSLRAEGLLSALIKSCQVFGICRK